MIHRSLLVPIESQARLFEYILDYLGAIDIPLAAPAGAQRLYRGTVALAGGADLLNHLMTEPQAASLFRVQTAGIRLQHWAIRAEGQLTSLAWAWAGARQRLGFPLLGYRGREHAAPLFAALHSAKVALQNFIKAITWGSGLSSNWDTDFQDLLGNHPASRLPPTFSHDWVEELRGRMQVLTESAQPHEAAALSVTAYEELVALTIQGGLHPSKTEQTLSDGAGVSGDKAFDPLSRLRTILDQGESLYSDWSRQAPIIPSPISHRPFWDRQARTLRLGAVLCCQFDREAPDQEEVLDAFQKADWPAHPIILGSPGDLGNTVTRLNARLKTAPIVFQRAGLTGGKSVRWQAK